MAGCVATSLASGTAQRRRRIRPARPGPGSKPDMLALKRSIHETCPSDPDERQQLFYIQKQVARVFVHLHTLGR